MCMRLYASLAALALSLSNCVGKPDYQSKLPADCYVSESGATILCKKYDSNKNLGAVIELHPDFRSSFICSHTRGNQDLCDFDQIADLERKLFGYNPPGPIFFTEAAALGVLF